MKSKFFALLLLVVSFNSYAWTQMPGAGRDVADGWVIGTSATTGGFSIHRWDESSWTRVSGGAVRIGGTYSNPWIINDVNQIFRWTGSTWQSIPGAAFDVADGWVIGTSATSGGFQIYRWNGSGWTLMPGGAVRIGGTYTTPWIVNNLNQIFRWTGSSWQWIPGAAKDVGDGWVLGTAAASGGLQIFRWNGSTWTQTAGGATGIGGAGGTPWLVNSSTKIYRW